MLTFGINAAARRCGATNETVTIIAHVADSTESPQERRNKRKKVLPNVQSNTWTVKKGYFKNAE